MQILGTSQDYHPRSDIDNLPALFYMPIFTFTSMTNSMDTLDVKQEFKCKSMDNAGNMHPLVSQDPQPPNLLHSFVFPFYLFICPDFICDPY